MRKNADVPPSQLLQQQQRRRIGDGVDGATSSATQYAVIDSEKTLALHKVAVERHQLRMDVDEA